MSARSPLEQRLPTLTRYLERLPRGLASYPEAQVKASVYRDALGSRSLDEVLDVLPEQLRELIEHPLPVTAWVPEVQSLSILIAVRDWHFSPDAAGLDAYAEWVFERNRRLLQRPLYRALFLLLDPERLLVSAERRWGAFRRGTSLAIVERSQGRAVVAIRHPPHLLDLTAQVGMCAALRAASVAAGARDVRSELLPGSDLETRCQLFWR